MGEAAGDALANAITLIDGLVVIGGGLTGAADLFLPALVAEMNARLRLAVGHAPRGSRRSAFNLEDPAERAAFLKGEAREIAVPGSTRKVAYDPLQRDRRRPLAARHEPGDVAIGAYAFALSALDAQPLALARTGVRARVPEERLRREALHLHRLDLAPRRAARTRRRASSASWKIVSSPGGIAAVTGCESVKRSAWRASSGASNGSYQHFG